MVLGMFNLDLPCLLDPEALQESGEKCEPSRIFALVAPPVYARNSPDFLHVLYSRTLPAADLPFTCGKGHKTKLRRSSWAPRCRVTSSLAVWFCNCQINASILRFPCIFIII